MKLKLELTPEQRAMLSGRQPRVYASYELREAEVEGSEGRFLRGRAVPYDAWTDTGWYRERVMPGAFAKSIKESAHALPLLLFHDSRTFPVCAAEEWSEEPDGLVGLWRMDEDDPEAMQALDKAGKGMLTGLSVGFAPIEDWREIDGELKDVNNEVEMDDTGTFWVTRRQARLLEVSLTPTPAYVGAGVLEVRSVLDRMPSRSEPRALGTPRRDALASRMARLGLAR